VFNRPSIGKRNFHITVDSVFIKTVITPTIADTANNKEDEIYNLLGQPVKEMQPGQMYIRNRKKFIYRP
jgi:hypothetical protein